MKIAQVLLSPRIGGAETLALALEQAWLAEGVTSKTVFLDEGERRRSRLHRVRHIRRVLHDYHPDIVVAHSYLPALYARLAWAGRAPVHSVLHSAEDDHAGRRSRFIERVLASRTASVIAVSSEQLSTYQRHFNASLPSIVIPNGVAPTFLPKLSYSATPRRVVTLARVAPQKSPDLWRRVVTLARSQRPDLEFEWWGPLSGDPLIDAAVLDDLPGNARYMGPTDDPNAVLQRSDIVLQTASREAHSIALLEAAITGTPVVYSSTVDSPGASPYWRRRFDFDSESSALECVTEIADSWEQSVAEAQSFARDARLRFDVRHTARAYLAWFGQATGRACDLSTLATSPSGAASWVNARPEGCVSTDPSLGSIRALHD